MVANVKISDMTPGAALAGGELLEMVQSAGTFSVTVTQMQTFCTLIPAANAFSWVGRSKLTSGADGSVTLATASATNSVTLTASATNALTITGTIKAGNAVTTVAGLGAAGTAGRRAYVTDSNAALTAGIGAVVAGGGANVVPVFDDGTNWRIG